MWDGNKAECSLVFTIEGIDYKAKQNNYFRINITSTYM